MASTSIRVTLNLIGIGQIARSAEVQAEIQRRADAVAVRARELMPIADWAAKIEATTVVGRRRIHGSVIFPGGEAYEAAHRVLAQAIDAARD